MTVTISSKNSEKYTHIATKSDRQADATSCILLHMLMWSVTANEQGTYTMMHEHTNEEGLL